MVSNLDKEKLKAEFTGIYRIKEIIDYIDEITDIYHYEYGNLIIDVYYRKNKDKLDTKKVQRVLMRCYKISNQKKIFKIKLFLSPAKKKIDNHKILTTVNANSGFTYPSRNEIYIFREEEYPKVLLHELIHHVELVDNQKFKDSNKLLLQRHFNITKDTILILNETIVELWALLIHLSFISCEYKLNFKKLFNLEMQYSLYKTYQILKLKEGYKDKKWCDRCNIYSYIVFKTIIMMHINEFLNDIYTYPYDDTKVTKFIIQKSSSLPSITQKAPINPKYKNFQRPSDSLCFMLLSDL